MNINRNLLLTGWVLYLLCLVIPSATIVVPFSGDNDLLGIEAGLYSIIAIPNFFDSFREFQISIMGIENIIAVLSPLLLFKWNKFFYSVFFVFISLAFVFASKLGFVTETSVVESLHIGYYVWVVSLLILSIGIGRKIIK